MAFRDEHAALLERVALLEQELAGARAGGSDASLAREVRELAERVKQATAQVDADRAALREIDAALERLQAYVGEPPKPTQERQEGGDAATHVRMIVTLCVLAVGFVPLIWFVLHQASSPAVTPARSAPAKLDATALLPVARAKATAAGLAADGKLAKISAFYVGSDGLARSGPSFSGRIEYEFFAAPDPPVPSPSVPLGAPRAAPTMYQHFTVAFNEGDEGRVEQTLVPILFQEAVPDPKCTLANVWAAAREAGAPPDAVAVIEYQQATVPTPGKARQPQWTFEIRTTAIKLTISDEDCSVVR